MSTMQYLHSYGVMLSDIQEVVNSSENPFSLKYTHTTPHYTAMYRRFERWMLHNEDPDKYAVVIHDSDLEIKINFVKGKLHSLDDNPAVFVDCPSYTESFWYKNGKKHRIGEPARYVYNKHLRVKLIQFYKNGKKHNDDNAASMQIGIDHDGVEEILKGTLKYYKNGKRVDHEMIADTVDSVFREHVRVYEKSLMGIIASYAV